MSPRRTSVPPPSAEEEARFRAIYRRVHADHAACLADEWAGTPCAAADGPVRPIVWSRRNGPWRRVPLLWVGAAPGNAGGLGSGDFGAHATRIPFGGDVAGANLDVLLGSIGTNRNETFITASLNQLPARGGGEPTTAEMRAPVGTFPSSVHLLRDTLVATGASLLVALGNVALRAVCSAVATGAGGPRLPMLARVAARTGYERNDVCPLTELWAPDAAFIGAWQAAWPDAPFPHILWLTHPSAQNMSPFAHPDTLFHTRMLEARAALRRAVNVVLGQAAPAERAASPTDGIYALPEWRERIGPRHARLDALWRAHGV